MYALSVLYNLESPVLLWTDVSAEGDVQVSIKRFIHIKITFIYIKIYIPKVASTNIIICRICMSNSPKDWRKDRMKCAYSLPTIANFTLSTVLLQSNVIFMVFFGNKSIYKICLYHI